MEEKKDKVENNLDDAKDEKKSDEESKVENKKDKKDKFLKEIDSLKEKIKGLEKEVDNYKDKYYRSVADLDNQRKQYNKEYSTTLKYSSQNLAEKLLPSFEMFQSVLEAKDNLPPAVSPYIVGFDMVYRQMVQALESEGISEIKVKIGDKFDHSIHYAMEAVEVEDEKQIDTIVKICSKGYKIHDRLLKPVTVVVGKAKEIKKENNEEAQA